MTPRDGHAASLKCGRYVEKSVSWKQYTYVQVHSGEGEGKRISLRESLDKYSSRKDFCLKANGLLPNTSVFTGGHMNALGGLWQITENPNQNLKGKRFTISLGKIS